LHARHRQTKNRRLLVNRRMGPPPSVAKDFERAQALIRAALALLDDAERILEETNCVNNNYHANRADHSN
jgi:hypothetical protein